MREPWKVNLHREKESEMLPLKPLSLSELEFKPPKLRSKRLGPKHSQPQHKKNHK